MSGPVVSPAAAPVEFAPASITSNFVSTTTASFQLVTGLSKTIVAGSRPIYITCRGQISNSVAGGITQWELVQDGATVLDLHAVKSTAANDSQGSQIFARFVGTPGQSYLFEVYARPQSGGGTASVIAAATAPVLLTAVEV